MKKMKVNRRELVTMGAASDLSARSGENSAGMVERMPSDKSDKKKVYSPNTSIRDYLSLEARKITGAALSDFKDAETWRKLYPGKRGQFLDMMGFADLAPYPDRPKVHYTITV